MPHWKWVNLHSWAASGNLEAALPMPKRASRNVADTNHTCKTQSPKLLVFDFHLFFRIQILDGWTERLGVKGEDSPPAPSHAQFTAADSPESFRKSSLYHVYTFTTLSIFQFPACAVSALQRDGETDEAAKPAAHAQQ